ncbi:MULTISPECIES: patatin-like phospholipase family protein [unclassified Undibacterium]|uniref:patatin-like phospholipase family protein n=1 Tax=unclassified Undibacterium TaxID=2630295 RepID=UPI002AC92AD5|nr:MULTISPECIES: patatin-like phospholipase family protein [unclassified Undibacterium]MEB0137687.1 patatin-like phospholipase family protein [Undibacterium sp. CCC2.1]MEB0172661.1 patatin-like phospholipase family protein [Undibacterium sp. CCC1.1]MEB0177594.1 patatin-like phospholipase family protein [Undibacterium sp. CCC3.4]MEB0215456.1 patatin-like phospholipase family protein [Undibacterium sp. 5I2]WPX42261.1 patatin-like phospholipase family protein [Undibacterium sp. CCC3.4]
MPQQSTVFILQGGGALGAYQAGVYQRLHEAKMPLDWVIGTSIGAINGALIAGNPPEQRVSRLRDFWDSLAPDATHRASFWPTMAPWININNTVNTIGTLVNGVDGFFKPRPGAAWDIHAKVALNQTAFYDTSPLKTTLEKYVDFDYLNSGAIRLSVCAVDLDNGQSAIFDNTKQVLLPEHIMASGALPPGFPAVEIDGRAYWDGGVYSNSPLEVFLAEHSRKDALCFMVDLWDPTETRPESIAEAMARYKNIQYASRSKEQLLAQQRIQDLQRAIRALAEQLPANVKQQKHLQALIAMGCEHTINVVNLIMKALPDDHYFKDVDFSSNTVQARWAAGEHDCQRALAHQAWLQPLPPHAGLIIHELPQE